MSYRQSQFDNVESKNINKSEFNLSHEIKTQMCFGRYYPIFVEECLPGDEWTIDGEYQFRFPSLYFPIQQIGTMRCDIFYAPYRILWKTDQTTPSNPQQTGWQGFIQGEDLDIPVTKLNINGAGFGGSSGVQIYPGCSWPIENYLGFPMDIEGRVDADKQMSILGSAFPLSMYLACYDEYYRNPRWEDPVFFNLDEGDNSGFFNAVKQQIDGVTYIDWNVTGAGNKIINHAPFFAHYEKDYFTASRPQPQDGEAIKIPFVEDDADALTGTGYPTKWLKSDGTPVAVSENLVTAGGVAGGKTITGTTATDVGLQMDATIKKLRLYQVLQQFHERVMRIGKRYRDYVKGLWGNDPEPSVIDIPQLIGSHFGRIQITDTITTADTSDAQTGNYRGNINFHNNGTTHHYFCQDYGLIMGIINVMPNTAYSQGIHPLWTREVNTDFALDMFSGIGDQEIKRKELHVLNVAAIWSDPDEPYNATIGYQDRFAEYKTRINRIFNTQELYESLYMGQRLSPIEANYGNINAGQIILGASYPLTNGIREADVFNSLPIKSGASVYTDATIFAHFYMTLLVKRCLPYFSTPGKQIF